MPHAHPVPLRFTGAVLGLALASMSAHATVRFVRADLATGANNGSSWADAFRGPLGLQGALAVALPGDEVWASAGVYIPGPPGDRAVSFALRDGVGVYGGFAGVETLRSQRDPALRVTVLSGDLAANGDDAPFDADNAFHVVTADAAGPSAVLDGFTIRGGETSCCGGIGAFGGGLRVIGGAPTIRACTFAQNEASAFGGDVSIHDASPLIESCVFTCTSSAQRGLGVHHTGASAATIRACIFAGEPPTTGGSAGAGIYSDTTSPLGLTVEDCDFSIRSQPFTCTSGVGLYVFEGSRVTVRRSRFIGNFTCGGGGGIHCDGFGTVDRCVFIGNEGRFDGGAALFSFHGELLVTNCLFSGNDRQGFSTVTAQSTMRFVNCTFANNGEPDNFHFVVHSKDPATTFDNCVFWGNESSLTGMRAVVFVPGGGTNPVFNRCIVEGWDGVFPGAGSFDADPVFADRDGADNVPGTIDDDLRPGVGSPMIDAGDSALVPPGAPLDLAGGPRFVDAIHYPDAGPGAPPVVDIGAFEAPALLGAPCPADLNGDGVVGAADLAALLGAWGAGASPADLSGDGVVGAVDLAALLGAWGAC